MMAATSAPPQWTYDVFVSFRGEDIRKSFMDHLFKDFKQKGIHAFKDDKELPRGEELSPKLCKAIEESRFLMIIFSKNYASSSWCLRELKKILECKQVGGHKHELRVIFYDVKPNMVRKQTGSYAKAFAKHVISNSTEVAEWKEALYQATSICGQDLHDTTNGYESMFIDNISEDILKKLCCDPLHVGDNLVGMYVNQMDLSCFMGQGKVHMIGICGISGIGKTTFARAIFNNLCTRFEECCFCEDVKGITKQKGLTQVQKLLIENIMKTTAVKVSNVSQGIMVIKKRLGSRRILLVLDDVEDQEQLEALAGSSNWFFPGSFIIFTSKDKKLIRSHKVDEIYDMKFLPHHEALKLFCLYAFGKKYPSKDFEELAYQVVGYLQGHPLALKILGTCLYEKPKHVWKSELDRLKAYPLMKIQQKLRPSFDGLDFDQKRIFLDIACSLIGENKHLVASVLESNDCFPEANIEVLLDKSLITMPENDTSIKMHDLIQSMTKEIVREESKRPGERSRLCVPSEICNVLSENKVTEAVEVLNLLLVDSMEKVHIDVNVFTKMKNLRILKICDQRCGIICHQLELWNDSKVNYSGRLEFLSDHLRLLYWHGYPFKFLPLDFYPKNIVAIDLSYIHITNLWTTPKCFRRLEVLKLRHCRNLTCTPDFTEITNLKELILEGCVKLVQVHPSFGMLKRLVVLNMRNCTSFRNFLCEVETNSLEVMDLSGFSKMDKLPKFSGTIKTLKKLYVDGTALTVTKLLSFVFSQNNLEKLSIVQDERIRSRCWTSVSQYPCSSSKMQHSQSLVLYSLGGLCSLRELDFSNCNILEVPDSIGGLSCLEFLSLHGNNFTRLPGSLSSLSRLQSLGLSECKNLEMLPELPSSIFHLDASHCTSLEQLQGLHNRDHPFANFYFTGCPKLCKNLTIDNQVSTSQTQSLNSSHSGNQFSSLLWFIYNHINVCRLFNVPERVVLYSVVDIAFYGNKIPQWFTNLNSGNCLKIEMPQGWDYNKFRGYVTCVVFASKKSFCSITLKYLVNNFDGALLDDPCPFFFYDSLGTNGSNMIWLHYTTDKAGWRKAKDFVTFSFKGNDDVEVKECGVRLVCDEDIQEHRDLCIIQELPLPTEERYTIKLFGNFHMFVSW